MFVSEQLQVDGLRSSLHAPVLRKKSRVSEGKSFQKWFYTIVQSAHIGIICECQPDCNFYLCEGNEEQLFMCVSKSRQGSLRTMFPHPLLICLQSERQEVRVLWGSEEFWIRPLLT